MMRSKVLTLLASRKFWTLLGAVVADAGAYFTHQIDATTAITALVGAVAAYQLATGVEDHGIAVARGNVVASGAIPPVDVPPVLPPRG